MITRSSRLLKSIFRRINHTLELRKYDNFTIAQYFRKQGVQIGDGCCIFPRILGGEPYLVKIGNHVCINAGVRLHTHDGGTWVFRLERPDLRVFGPIIIEDNCFIGESAKILPNVTIGRNSIVGAGSVVITDVPPNSIVMGVPARSFGSIDRYKMKCLERWKEQRPPGFHPDSSMHWERSDHVQEIRMQLKTHLTQLFKDRLD